MSDTKECAAWFADPRCLTYSNILIDSSKATIEKLQQIHDTVQKFTSPPNPQKFLLPPSSKSPFRIASGFTSFSRIYGMLMGKLTCQDIKNYMIKMTLTCNSLSINYNYQILMAMSATSPMPFPLLFNGSSKPKRTHDSNTSFMSFIVPWMLQTRNSGQSITTHTR
jgi:hypothetical protein